MILFLDFDGVLNVPSHYGNEMFEMSRLKRLEALVLAYDLQVVISSSWRETFSLDDIKGFMSDSSICNRIIGVTPIVNQGKNPPYAFGIRQREVEQWMEENGYAGKWVALDDDHRIFDLGCENLVKCEFSDGFDEDAGRRLEDYLKKHC
jgi:hypothetical protein